MSKRRIRLGPFGDLYKGVVDRYVPGKNVSDKCNIRDTGLAIQPRLGYFNIRSAGTDPKGFFHLQGYSTSEIPENEYLLIDHNGTNIMVKSLEPSGLTETATLYNVVAAANQNDWFAVAFQDKAIITNRSTMFYHDVGDITSWVDTFIGTKPAKPTSLLLYPTSIAPGYSQIRLDGVNPAANVTYTGNAQAAGSIAAANATLPIRINHNSGPPAQSSFEIDMTAITAGNINLRQADFFCFVVKAQQNFAFEIDPDTLRLSFDDDSVGNEFAAIETIVHQVNATTWNVWCRFKKENRDLWATLAPAILVDRLKLSYTVVRCSGSTVKTVDLYPIWIGGMDYNSNFGALGSFSFLSFVDVAMSFRSSATGIETDLSDTLRLDVRTQFKHSAPLSGPFPDFGTRIQFTGGVTGTADQERWYIRRSPDGAWYRFAEQADTVAGWTWEPEVLVDPTTLPEQEAWGFRSDLCVSMFTYRGSTCYLYDVPSENVRYSAVGYPFRQYSEAQNQLDEDLGETFTFADNYADTPLRGFAVGDAAIILGKLSAAAHGGNAPRLMTPIKSIPRARGCYSIHSCCKWNTAGGEFGVAWLDPSMESVWFAVVGDSFDGERGYTLQELSLPIRGFVREWLVGSDPTPGTPGRVSMFADRDGDLWIIHKRRALAFRKKIDGNYTWEPYEYAMSSYVKFVDSSHNYGVRWIKGDGKTGELERKYSTGAIANGVNRDGGSPLPRNKTFITSPMFFGANTRIQRVYRDAASDADRIQMVAQSTRKTTTKEFPANQKLLRFDPLQQGHEQKITIRILNDSAQPLYGIDFDLIAHGGERPAE